MINRKLYPWVYCNSLLKVYIYSRVEPLHVQARYFLNEIGGGLPSLLATLIRQPDRSDSQAEQSEEAVAERSGREEEAEEAEEAENAAAESSVSWGRAVMKKIVNGEEMVFKCLVSPDPLNINKPISTLSGSGGISSVIRHFDSKCHTSFEKVFA